MRRSVLPAPRLLAQLADPSALRVAFRPIFEVGGETRPFGAECVVRGPLGTPAEDAATLLEFVRRKHAAPVVDRACLTAAFRATCRLPLEYNLVVSLHGETLGRDREIVVFLGDEASRNSLDLSRIVVQLVGEPPVFQASTFANNLEGLRAVGVRFAVTFGAAGSDFRAALGCRPQYLRLGRPLVAGLSRDHYRQAIAVSVATLAARVGARVVAEGVEQREDLELLESLGIDLVQGALLGGLPQSVAQRCRLAASNLDLSL